jgi:hypothetical protein
MRNPIAILAVFAPLRSHRTRLPLKANRGDSQQRRQPTEETPMSVFTVWTRDLFLDLRIIVRNFNAFLLGSKMLFLSRRTGS